MQAIILAAGMGKRLKEYTQNNTKCMVKVNGITMIERCLRILDKKGLSRIVLVVGYEGQKLIDYTETLGVHTPIQYINNPIYDKTNNIYSLALAKEYMCEDDTLLLESDLIFQEEIIDILLADERETLALVDKFESWMDGTCMELDDDDCIVNFISGKHLQFADTDNYYKTVNIYKFSKSFSINTYVPFLLAYEKAMGENEYYESVIKLIAMLETKEIRAKRLKGQIWYEIDNVQDLDIAESLFADSSEEHLNKLSGRYGGYWRYPKLLDFCYLVNPYYPPTKMKEEIKANFDILLTQYPSGMRVNALLASNNFGVKQEHIVIGNGAAELIKVLMETLEGKVGCIYPTFQEYPNRCKNTNIVPFTSSKADFSYSVDDLIGYYSDKNIKTLILINPDNPSGNYCELTQIVRLIAWCKERSVRLIVDESFVDFAESSCESTTLLREDILQSYDELYVIKSISKSYGVPGIRLGILASSNEKVIVNIKQKISIWNINSYGEFFMQIMGKYGRDYEKSLDKIKESRNELIEELKKIPFLQVFPSQANYVMCRLVYGTSEELCAELLDRNVLIKDLTKKVNNGEQYVRIAVRSNDENQILISLLKNFVFKDYNNK